MSVVGEYALKSLRATKTRTALSIVGIALACALVTAIFSTVTTIQAALVQNVLATNGAWEISFSNLTDAGAHEIVSSQQNEGSSLVRRYGVASLGAGGAGYFSVMSLPTDETVADMLPRPEVTSGRLPESSSEIILPDTLRGTLPSQVLTNNAGVSVPDGFRIGATLTADLGERCTLSHDGLDGTAIADDAWPTYDADGKIAEEIVGTNATTFTIVGFYDSASYWWSSYVGWDGITFDDGNLAAHSTSVFLITGAEATREELESYADGVTAEAGPLDSASGYRVTSSLNDGLLDLQGRSANDGIWAPIKDLATLLVGVVLVAAVALVYNSFAISITERTRQFGLLSSLGASRKQLLRGILAEAFALSAVGIPLGILLGVIGSQVIFSLNGEGLKTWLSASTGNITGAVISPGLLLAAAALTFLTVIVSVALPAWRASRVSAVEAIRTTSELRKLRVRRRRNGKRKLLDSAALRLEGIPGLVARRNVKCGGARGRAAVLSLGLSVALVLTAGAVTSFMSVVFNDDSESAADVDTYVWRTLSSGEGIDVAFSDFEQFEERLSTIPGVTSIGYMTSFEFLGSAEPGLLNTIEDGKQNVEVQSDGSGAGCFEVVFLSDSAWRRYVAECGLSEDEFCDASRPTAIALNDLSTNADNDHVAHDPFSGAGAVTLYTEVASLDGKTLDAIVYRDGIACARYVDASDDSGDGDTYVPVSEAALSSYELPVAATTTKAPDVAPSIKNAPRPVLLLPSSAIGVLAASANGNAGTGTNANAGGSGQASSLESGRLCAPLSPATLEESGVSVSIACKTSDSVAAASEINSMVLAEYADGPLSASAVDRATSARERELVIGAIKAFASSFAIVCVIIAVGNVFNTISTSMRLRRGEFAVLRSAGMGERDFRRMLVRECASYAIRGMVLGIALSAVVTYVLYGASAFSAERITQVVPPAWFASAVALVLVVLVASVLYALHTDRETSIVETLRENAC